MIKRDRAFSAVQIVLSVPDGLNGYLRSPDQLVTEATRQCPFCPQPHRLQLNGHYSRTNLLPSESEDHRIAVRRLRCTVQGRTVSLLPDFCLPRRQHGPAVLALFLQALLLATATLLGALRSARPSAPCHAVAQSLLAGFRRQAPLIRTYLATIQPRAPDPPSDVPVAFRDIGHLVCALRHGFPDLATAFVHHGRELHRRFGVALA